MQTSQAPLKLTVNTYLNPLNASKAKERSGQLLSSSSSPKEFMGAYKSRITIPISKEQSVLIPPEKTFQHQTRQLDEECIKATKCLLSIEDPLWKRVCRDVMVAMGAVSLLKIWDSILGEFCSQDQNIEIHCQTEEIAQFIQQYDFVILGSLQPYFPALKRLRIKIISTL